MPDPHRIPDRPAPMALRNGREILLEGENKLLAFPRPIDARAYCNTLHSEYFVCQTDRGWRFSETAGCRLIQMPRQVFP